MKIARILAVILTLCLVLSAACGCAGDDKTASGKQNDPCQSPTAETGTPGMDPSVDPELYRGTKVIYATWKDPWISEDGTVYEIFEEKYGIKFEMRLMGQGDYVKTIAASIASGTQPDIFFENGDFPGSLTVMQPLDAAKLDLSHPFWNQSLIEASTLAGHPYLVDAISNVWSEFDLCVYNKHIFEAAGIKTPDEYFIEGKWTFENFRYAAQQVTKLGKDYIGAGILGESILAAAGSAFFTYKDDQLTVTADPHLLEVMDFVSQMKADGIAKLDRGGFGEGRQGMAFTNCFGLKRTGYFTQINPEHMAATYLPVWKEGDRPVVSGMYRGWGLVENAKNPVGAGLFLCEYLNIDNYDLDATFHNDDVAEFFFEITEVAADGMFFYHGSDIVKTTQMGQNYHETWSPFAPDELKTHLNSELPVMEEMAGKANDIINKEKEWLTEEYK